MSSKSKHNAISWRPSGFWALGAEARSKVRSNKRTIIARMKRAYKSTMEEHLMTPLEREDVRRSMERKPR